MNDFFTAVAVIPIVTRASIGVVDDKDAATV